MDHGPPELKALAVPLQKQRLWQLPAVAAAESAGPRGE